MVSLNQFIKSLFKKHNKVMKKCNQHILLMWLAPNF